MDTIAFDTYNSKKIQRQLMIQKLSENLIDGHSRVGLVVDSLLTKTITKETVCQS